MAARTLENLREQYSGKAGAEKKRGGGMRGGPRIMGGGKPQNTRQTIGRLLGYLKSYRIHLFFVFFCMLFSTVTSLCGSYFLLPIINRLANAASPGLVRDTGGDGALAALADSIIEKFRHAAFIENLIGDQKFAEVLAYLVAALIVLSLVYAVGAATTYLQARLMLATSQGATEKIRNDLFCKLDRLSIRFFDNHPTGEVMSRFTNDVDNIDMMLNNTLVNIVSGMITLIGTFTFMVTTNWKLTLITVLFVPVFAKGGTTIAKLSSKYYSGQQKALGAVNGYIEETVAGQKVIKIFNHEDTCVEEFTLLNDDLRDKQFKAQFYGGIMGPIMGNTSQISYAVTLGVGGILMVKNALTPGGLTVFANYSRHFSQPINTISQQMSTIFAALAGAERVFQIMDMPPERPDADDAVPLEGHRADVHLDHVCFGYRPEHRILNDVSFYAKPGQKIALVGSTGAGKTTITNLLNRFYDIDEGVITIDGIDIRKFPRSELRKNIAVVLQDTHLFTGTVRENIRYGRLDATDEEVEAAAKTASAHSFIMKLENGYDTVLEGDGANLSQGQRQLLNIARAAISKAPILVLDEATSSVDTRTERLIEQGMDSLMQDRTTFVIAHRLSTVRNANAIMVLEKGVIIERGTHDELLEQKGRYYELYTGAAELS